MRIWLVWMLVETSNPHSITRGRWKKNNSETVKGAPSAHSKRFMANPLKNAEPTGLWTLEARALVRDEYDHASTPISTVVGTQAPPVVLISLFQFKTFRTKESVSIVPLLSWMAPFERPSTTYFCRSVSQERARQRSLRGRCRWSADTNPKSPKQISPIFMPSAIRHKWGS